MGTRGDDKGGWEGAGGHGLLMTTPSARAWGWEGRGSRNPKPLPLFTWGRAQTHAPASSFLDLRG